VSTEFNPVPLRYLSTSPVRDNAAINFLTGVVTNPFRGIDAFRGTAFFANANTTRGQLLRPLPHFGGLPTGLPAGAAWYHALTARFERRFAHGFMVQANYTWAKAMEAVQYLNPTDDIPAHIISDVDRTHRFTFAGMWDLPVFKGNRWLGGWQLQALYQGQGGPPLSFGNVIYSGTYPALEVSNPPVQRWFNIDGFERRPAFQLEQNVRSFPLRLANVRGDGINVWDMSVLKNFKLHEKLTVQLRGEAEGATNTPNFSPPNTASANTLFGQVTATQTGQEERRIFVGLKLIF